MRERTLSALVIVPVVVLAIAAGGVGIGILVLVLAALAAREAERLLPAAGRPVIRNGVVGRRARPRRGGRDPRDPRQQAPRRAAGAPRPRGARRLPSTAWPSSASSPSPWR